MSDQGQRFQIFVTSINALDVPFQVIMNDYVLGADGEAHRNIEVGVVRFLFAIAVNPQLPPFVFQVHDSLEGGFRSVRRAMRERFCVS